MTMNRILTVLGLCAVVALAACGGGDESSAEDLLDASSPEEVLDRAQDLLGEQDSDSILEQAGIDDDELDEMVQRFLDEGEDLDVEELLGDITEQAMEGAAPTGDDTPTPVWYLTGERVPTEGTTIDPSYCEDQSGPGVLSWAVPSEWSLTGSGSSGENGSLTWSTPDGSTVNLDLERDPRGSDGELLVPDGSDTLHDRSYQVTDADGSRTETIDFSLATEVSVDERFVAIHRALAADHPSELVDDEYRVLIPVAELPAIRTQLSTSYVLVRVNITPGSSLEQTVFDLISSARVDECWIEETLTLYELLHQVDYPDEPVRG